MLHTLKLLQGSFNNLVSNNFQEGGAQSSGDMSESKWTINDPKIEVLPLEDKPEAQAVQAESSKEREKVKQEVINMNLINSAGTIRPGDSGEAVKELQKFLNKYYKFNLPIDGEFGTPTFEAVTVLQYNNKLKTDSIIGPKTKAAMQNMITAQKDIREPIKQSSPTKVFQEDSVSREQLNEQLDTTDVKLDALNLMITRGSEITTAIEAYINGGDRDQFISDRGGAFGWVREGIGANEFDKQLDNIDGLSETQIKNIRDAIKQVLGGAKKKVSPQVIKDLVVIATSLAASGAKTLSLPVFHIFNKFSSKLVNFGIDLRTANNLGVYIESGANEEFDLNGEYVSDHGVDALGATAKLKNMLREYGISDGSIDAALQGEVGETSDKIRTVTQSFLTHIVGRDLDAITKGSFNALEKSLYIPFAKKEAIPGNPDVKMRSRYFGGDPKYGVARKVVAKIYSEIATLDDDSVQLKDVLSNVDTRMEGITYLLDQQVNDYKGARGGNEAKRNLITKSVGDLNEKLDYMNSLMGNAKFFDNYVAMSENRELVREYSILQKFDSIETILSNFPTSVEVQNKLLSLDENSSEVDFKQVLDEENVSEYLAALTDNDSFAKYRISQLPVQEGLTEIKVATSGKHGLPVNRDSSGADVVKQMLLHTVDKKHSVMTSVEQTLIDNGITSVTSVDIVKAMTNKWEVVDIQELSGVVINTARGGGADNDEVTTFADLAERKGDSFMFRTQIEKTLKYTDKDGAVHTVDYTYDIYFRPECKNPIIYPGTVKVDGSVVDPTSPDFNTAVPALITGTIPVWINIDLEGSNPVSNQTEDGATPTEPNVTDRDGATLTDPNAVNEGANGTVDPVAGTGGPGDTGGGSIGDGAPVSAPGTSGGTVNPSVPTTTPPATGGSGNSGGGGITSPGGSTPPSAPPPPPGQG